MTPSMRRGTRIAVVLAVLPALLVPIAAIAASHGAGGYTGPGVTPSFTRDVAPVIQQKCAGCHQVGGIAPFPLETASQISSRASLIGASVQAGLMPPWPPGGKSPSYVGRGGAEAHGARAGHHRRAGRAPAGGSTAPRSAGRGRPRRGCRRARGSSTCGCRPSTGRAHRRARPTTTAASSSTRGSRATASSRRRGSSRARRRSSTT